MNPFLFQIVIYEPRPGDAIQSAIHTALAWGLWPDHIVISPRALDHVSQDIDPPGRMLLTAAHGLNIVVDEDWLGCNLICEVPFPHSGSDENIADLMVVWDTNPFDLVPCGEDCDCE